MEAATRMSRFRNTARSVSSGYLAMASNVFYTLASVPLALHYLSKDEFGLWALAMQVAAYLQLMDLGVTGAVWRILIDHKDDKTGAAYNSVIKTSVLVFVVQGLIVMFAGSVVAYFVPGWMNVPAQYTKACRILIASQCIMNGALFGGRVLMAALQAHQRFDAINYSQIVQFVASLVGLWIGFHYGMGVYSLLLGSAVLCVSGLASTYVWAARLKLLRAGTEPGKAGWETFKSLFHFGTQFFLMMVGMHLVSASQVVVVSWKLGLAAAAVWAVATKVYPLAFQLVTKPFDFSTSAFAEMVARGERALLQRRFREVLLLVASGAVFVGAGVAVCNESFVAAWTRGKISWAWQNDILLGALLVITCVTKCPVAMIGPFKKVGIMSIVYFLEGLVFIAAACLTAPRWGMLGVLSSAIVADILLTGAFGFWFVAKYLGITAHEMLFKWLGNAWRYLLLMAVIGFGTWWTTHGLFHQPDGAGDDGLSRIYPLARLAVQSGIMMVLGVPLFWRVGLTAELRDELRGRFRSLMPGWIKKPAVSPAR
jgi:O-antigen/teichoic acid export membrane protein